MLSCRNSFVTQSIPKSTKFNSGLTTDGEMDVLVGVGTGGTLARVAEGDKARNPAFRAGLPVKDSQRQLTSGGKPGRIRFKAVPDSSEVLRID